ncbi:hypothetical protein LAJ19_12470 [Deinococcus taeanensis]|uniref:hypothetical protein n=1 Tax=Deinococcus taeanensis TaxID=2737050 RepID=UPI001CDC967A|nr:hypothetical protein [Deinococcus taeanensis]UBV42427.1 hypothetical protein LAJ19_12470 [Deinococcus taeanensis]
MTVPPAPPAPEFPVYTPRSFLPAFLLGWGLGVALTFAVRGAGAALLTDLCQGHTLLALLVPLLLGPGGLAFTAAHWRRPSRAALGLGLVLASLFPALFVGAQDIGQLRRSGCAGGYVLLTEPVNGQPGDSISSLSLPVGTERTLLARVGGYTAQTHPGVFTVRGASTAGGVSVTPGRTQVRAGEPFPVTIRVARGTPVNSYTATVSAATQQDGRKVEASGTLDLNVRPAQP